MDPHLRNVITHLKPKENGSSQRAKELKLDPDSRSVCVCREDPLHNARPDILIKLFRDLPLSKDAQICDAVQLWLYLNRHSALVLQEAKNAGWHRLVLLAWIVHQNHLYSLEGSETHSSFDEAMAELYRRLVQYATCEDFKTCEDMRRIQDFMTCETHLQSICKI